MKNKGEEGKGRGREFLLERDLKEGEETSVLAEGGGSL